MVPCVSVEYQRARNGAVCVICGEPAPVLLVVAGKTAGVTVCASDGMCAAKALAGFPLGDARPYRRR